MFEEYETSTIDVLNIIYRVELPNITNIEEADNIYNSISIKKKVLEQLQVVFAWINDFK